MVLAIIEPLFYQVSPVGAKVLSTPFNFSFVCRPCEENLVESPILTASPCPRPIRLRSHEGCALILWESPCERRQRLITAAPDTYQNSAEGDADACKAMKG